MEFQRLVSRLLTKNGPQVETISSGATSKAITFDLTEPNALYGVLITPGWSTTAYYTSRATTGFTLNFGTAPGSDSTATWVLVRED